MANLHTGEAWIGPSGSMVRLPYITSMEVSSGRAYTEFRGAAGSRRIQRSPRGSREWNISIPGYGSDEIGQLIEFLDMSPGPHAFVDPVARSVNLLTPRCSSLLDARYSDGTITYNTGYRSWNGIPGGQLGVGLGGNVAVNSWVTTGTMQTSVYFNSTFRERTPLVPGVPLTVSVHVNRLSSDTNVSLNIEWYNSGYSPTSISSSSFTRGPGVFREFVTIPEVPAGATSFLFSATSSASCEMFKPAASWTPELRPWGHGMGADSVAAFLDSYSPRRAFISGGGRTSIDSTFKVMEVWS